MRRRFRMSIMVSWSRMFCLSLALLAFAAPCAAEECTTTTACGLNATIRFASQYDGNGGEKIAAAIADLPDFGGTVVADLQGDQTIESDPFAALIPPVAATLSQVSGGSLSARTYYVRVTYVNASGETAPSFESSISITNGTNHNLLKVTSPPAYGGATAYNVYASTAPGVETKQTSSAVALGTDWTEPTSCPTTCYTNSNLRNDLAVPPPGKTGVLLLAEATYTVEATINVPSSWTIQGAYGGKRFGQGNSGTNYGTAFLTDPDTHPSPVIKVFDAHHTLLDGITVDCNSTSNSVGILIDSDNSPAGHHNAIQNFNIYRCTIGIDWGDGGSEEADKVQIFNGHIESWIDNSTGIRVRGPNKTQDSKIEAVTMTKVDTGLDLYQSSYLTVKNFSCGTPKTTGQKNPCIKTTGSANTIIESGSSESGNPQGHGDAARLFIWVPYDVDSNAGSQVLTLLGVRINEPILIEGAIRVISVGSAQPSTTLATSDTNGLKVNITTISQSGTSVTVNTQYKHHLAVGSVAIVRGVADTLFNGEWTVVTKPTDYQYTYTHTQSRTASGDTGTSTPSMAIMNVTAATGRLVSTRDYVNDGDGWTTQQASTANILELDDTGIIAGGSNQSITLTPSGSGRVVIPSQIKLTRVNNQILAGIGSDVASTLDIDFPDLATTAGYVRMFRSTNTDVNAGSGLLIDKPDGSGSISSRFAAFGNSYLNALTGSVGIGKSSTPAQQLDVAKSITSGVHDLGDVSGSATCNASLGNTCRMKLTADTTLTLSNATPGQLLHFMICQNSHSGGWTLTWSSSYFRGGVAITNGSMTANTCSAQDFIYDGTNSKAYAVSPGKTNM